jgi:hypothetical protein
VLATHILKQTGSYEQASYTSGTLKQHKSDLLTAQRIQWLGQGLVHNFGFLTTTQDRVPLPISRGMVLGGLAAKGHTGAKLPRTLWGQQRSGRLCCALSKANITRAGVLITHLGPRTKMLLVTGNW